MDIPTDTTIQSFTQESSSDEVSEFSPLNLIQLLIGVMGIMGNFLVCFIFLHRRTMRSQTNLLITNQAFIDILSSVLLVLHQLHKALGNLGIKGDFWQAINCYFWKSQLILFCTFAISTFNLTLISVERYIATIHPLSYKTVFTRKNMRCMIATVWMLSPILQYVIVWKTFTYRNGHCYIQWSLASVGVLLFFWEYMAPVSVMTFSFINIIKRLQRSNEVAHGSGPMVGEVGNTQTGTNRAAVISTGTSQEVCDYSSRNTGSSQGNRGTEFHPPVLTHQHVTALNQRRFRTDGNGGRARNVTKALLIVYLMYVICWSPNQWAFFQLNVGGKLNYDNFFYKFSIVLAISNSCVNPFIYALRHKTYKEGLRELWRNLFS